MTEALVARPPIALAAIKALRIKQWTKNGALLAPLLFAKGFLREGLPLKSAVAVAAFSLLASGVYLVNDWADKEKDRHHPEKRHRPIAAGLLNLPMVLALVAVCWGGAGALALWLGTPFLGVCGAYLVLQALYTWALKKAVILDVMAIAFGFILRVVAGAVAINVMVSNWLFLCTLLLAVFLGFAKRRHELSSLEGGAGAHRANLEDYSLPMLDQMMSISAAATIVGYALYTVSADTVEHVGSDKLKFTVPCVIYAVMRYLFLVHKRGAGGSPEKVLLSDFPLIVDLTLFVAISAWALYL